MTDKHGNLSLYDMSPYYQLFISLLIILGAGILLSIIFLFSGLLFFDLKLDIVENLYTTVDHENIGFLRFLMITQDISLFIIPAIIILTLMKPVEQNRFIDIKLPRGFEVILVIILVFCIFPINGFAGQLNEGMHFPDWLSGVEKWMVEKEDNANHLIDLLIDADTFSIMILNLIMIALLPAIGEELIFRGVFQKIFYRLMKSDHLAVVVTAFLFSAIHFQFFGFIPRFILGLVFGYLFLWSGTLWLPVISHFVNNAVPVIGSYIQGWDKINTLSENSIRDQFMMLPIPIIISLVILLYFRNSYKKRADNNFDQSLI